MPWDYAGAEVRKDRGAELSKISDGARRDRTADLLNAIQALSQLSYGPDRIERNSNVRRLDETCKSGVG